jgi:hypothetical protein
VVAKVATKRYEQATMALETLLCSLGTTQEMSLSEMLGFGTPYEACRAPVAKSQVAIRKEPMRRAGRRPKRSRYRIAGRVCEVRVSLGRACGNCERIAYHSDVDDVLNRGSKELISDTGSAHDEDNVVPISS